MRRDPTLSEEVQSYIQTLDWENEHGLTAEEKKKVEEGHKLVRGIVRYVLTSREKLAKYPFEELELFVQGAPDLVAEFLDQHYTREAVNSVHGYVDRTMELSHMKAERTPSKVTNKRSATPILAVRSYSFFLHRRSCQRRHSLGGC
jgi:hypothetical protein